MTSTTHRGICHDCQQWQVKTRCAKRLLIFIWLRKVQLIWFCFFSNGSALPRLYQSDGHSRAIRATDDTDKLRYQ